MGFILPGPFSLNLSSLPWLAQLDEVPTERTGRVARDYGWQV